MLALGNSYPPAARFRNEMDRLFSDFFGEAADGSRGGMAEMTFPPLNVWEDDEVYHVEAELPGFKMDDLDISMLGNQITIKGERKNETKNEDATYHRRERTFGSFIRTLRLPGGVELEKASATLSKGVLMLDLPKERAARARRIEVKNA